MSEKIMREAEYITERPPFPRNMLMEVTNGCNFDCRYCGYEHMTRGKGSCDKDLMLRLMDEAYRLGTREIGFYMIGEPLLKKDLEEYISHAKDLGFEYIYLTTNGIFATEERLLSLYEAGLNSINYSASGATEKTYEYMHNARPGDFKKFNENIDALDRLRKSGRIEMKAFISFCKCNENADEADRMIEMFQNKVDKVYIDECLATGGKNRRQSMMEKHLVDTIKSNISCPCKMVFNRIHITYQGYLDACCADMDNELAVADLREVSLEEAWYSDAMIDLRKQHMSGKLKNNMCFGCVHGILNEYEPLNPSLCR